MVQHPRPSLLQRKCDLCAERSAKLREVQHLANRTYSYLLCTSNRWHDYSILAARGLVSAMPNLRGLGEAMLEAMSPLGASWRSQNAARLSRHGEQSDTVPGLSK